MAPNVDSFARSLPVPGKFVVLPVGVGAKKNAEGSSPSALTSIGQPNRKEFEGSAGYGDADRATDTGLIPPADALDGLVAVIGGTFSCARNSERFCSCIAT